MCNLKTTFLSLFGLIFKAGVYCILSVHLSSYGHLQEKNLLFKHLSKCTRKMESFRKLPRKTHEDGKNVTDVRKFKA